MKFEIYQDSKGEWRWRLLAKNRRIIATSGEGYKRKSSCRKAVGTIIGGVLGAEIVEGDFMTDEKKQPEEETELCRDCRTPKLKGTRCQTDFCQRRDRFWEDTRR